MSSATLTAKARRWAEQLRAAGIDANLAPVADVVPKHMEKKNQPIGMLQRGYGPNPNVVAAKVTAFIRGMRMGGVTTAVKHFPGLGRVRGNTDYSSKVTDTTTKRHDLALKGFAAGSNSRVDMVMMSSAYYSKIDPKNRAVFSKKIIAQMLRKDLKFTGVVISDDLAARAVLDKSPGNRAVSFLKAGGDLIIVGEVR
jgi:beta-N-acetylhexosaminidase